MNSLESISLLLTPYLAGLLTNTSFCTTFNQGETIFKQDEIKNMGHASANYNRPNVLQTTNLLSEGLSFECK